MRKKKSKKKTVDFSLEKEPLQVMDEVQEFSYVRIYKPVLTLVIYSSFAKGYNT